MKYQWIRKQDTRKRPPLDGSGRRKVGVMWADVNKDGELCIGMSKCHTRLDPFCPEFGKFIAEGRAWAWYTRNSTPKIPHSCRDVFRRFVDRCVRYYKDAKPPAWAILL